MTPEQSLQLAFQHFDRGEFERAEAVCTSLLSASIHEHRAHQILGGIAFRRKHWDQAAQHFRAAIQIAPDHADYFDNLSTVLNHSGRPAEAEAVAREGLKRSPQQVTLWNQLGLALKAVHRLADAEAAFRQALAIRPGWLPAMNNLSHVLRLAGRADESETLCRDAIALHPTSAEVWINLGTALHDQTRYVQAIEAFDRALVLKPELAQAAFNRGVSQELLHQFSAAVRSYEQALTFQPNWSMAWNNLGVVRKLQGRLDDARNCFQQALALQPEYMVARTNLLATLQCCVGVSPIELLEAHRDWDRHHGAPLRSAPGSISIRRSKEQRLRIGFVSPDLGNHPVGRFLIATVEHLPRDQFDLHFYSDRPAADTLTRRFQATASVWCDSRRLTDEELDSRIRADEIDILIDLAGHTGQHRLLVFARKPAPIQATWIGYPGTTGLSAMDWIIADSVVVSPEHDQYYAERVARLPGPYVCFDPPPFARRLESSPPPCRARGYVTFGSFNKLDKTTSRVLRTWAEILMQVPESGIELRNQGFDEAETRQFITDQLVSHGVDPKRISCYGWATHEETLEAYRHIDIALDTFPFSGGATSADALWMGVPIVTLAGDTFASRQTASLLTHSGLTNTIATTEKEYIRMAVQLARNPEELPPMRRATFEKFRGGAVCDAIAHGQALGSQLAQMWEFSLPSPKSR